MINLINNELYKIVRKKSVIIFFIIIMAFMVLVNYVMSRSSDYVNNPYEVYIYEINDQEDYIESLLDNDYESLSKAKADLLALELRDSNETRWVFDYVNENYSLFYDYYYAFYTDYESSNYIELENSIENIKTNIESDNWEDYIQYSIDENNELIALTSDETDIEYLTYINNLYDYRLSENVDYDFGYLDQAINELHDDKTLEYYGSDDYGESILINEYILESKLDVNGTNNFKINMASFMFTYAQFIILFVLVIAGTILSSELSKGTIKTLLISPNSRTKILICKFIAVIKMMFISIILLLVFQFILSVIFYDISDFGIPMVTFNEVSKELELEHVILYLTKQILAFVPTILFLALIAFGITTVISNSAVAIVGTFMIYIFSELVNMYIIFKNIEPLKYLITLNWDFTCYLYGGANSFDVITLPFSVIIYLIYFISLIVVFINIFKRKNIKNV